MNPFKVLTKIISSDDGYIFLMAVNIPHMTMQDQSIFCYKSIGQQESPCLINAIVDAGSRFILEYALK